MENPKHQYQRSIDALSERVVQWWETIKNSSGDRAILRRAHSPDEAATTRPFFNLFRTIDEVEFPKNMSNRIVTFLPVIAGTLCHVDHNEPAKPVAKSMSMSSKAGSDRPRVSEIRFQRLMRTDDRDELYLSLIRMVRLLGKTANVRDLAESILFWNERTKKRWASLYYHKRDIFSQNEQQETITDNKGE
jgi:CRISPR system Cascade subunit CasB